MSFGRGRSQHLMATFGCRSSACPSIAPPTHAAFHAGSPASATAPKPFERCRRFTAGGDRTPDRAVFNYKIEGAAELFNAIPRKKAVHPGRSWVRLHRGIF